MLSWKEVAQIESISQTTLYSFVVMWLALTNRIWEEVIFVAAGPRLLRKEACAPSTLIPFYQLDVCDAEASGNAAVGKVPGVWMTTERGATGRLRTPFWVRAQDKLLPCQNITRMDLFITATGFILRNTILPVWARAVAGQRRQSRMLPNLCA